jgi:hypothetical protein
MFDGVCVPSVVWERFDARGPMPEERFRDRISVRTKTLEPNSLMHDRVIAISSFFERNSRQKEELTNEKVELASHAKCERGVSLGLCKT